jgi:hypothetical protein
LLAAAVTFASAIPVLAGIGSGISGLTAIDTEPPSVTVDQFPAFAFFQGGDVVNFHWSIADDNPGAVPENFTASVLIEGQVESTFAYYPDLAEAFWNWIVPEASSANVHLQVLAKDAFGNAAVGTSNSFTILASVTGVPAAPAGLALAAPAPNPFNPSTLLRFHLPEPGRVSLTVYDPRGRRVRTLVTGPRAAGDFDASWDGRDDRGRAQSGGVYLFVLDFRGAGPADRLTRKAVLIP